MFDGCGGPGPVHCCQDGDSEHRTQEAGEQEGATTQLSCTEVLQGADCMLPTLMSELHQGHVLPQTVGGRALQSQETVRQVTCSFGLIIFSLLFRLLSCSPNKPLFNVITILNNE